MWITIDKTVNGFVICSRNIKRRIKRKSALAKAIQEADRVFVIDKGDFVVQFGLLEFADKISDIYEITRVYASASEYAEILSNLEKLGFSVERLSSSIAGLSTQVKALIPEKFFILSSEERELAEKVFFGGRAENFVLDVKNEEGNIVCYDINSAYPFVMAGFNFPDTRELPKEITDISPGKVRQLYEEGFAGLCYVEVEESRNIPRLPKRFHFEGDDLTFYPTGKFEGWITSVEAMLFSDSECRVKKMLAYPLIKSPFRELVLKLYRDRLRFAGTKTEKVLKGIMNALFGVVSMKASRRSNRIIGAFITAYQRLRLYKALHKLSKVAKVLYCDTDSIWVSFESEKQRKEVEEILKVRKDKKLGAWGVRTQGVVRFWAVRPKAYIIEFEDGKKEYVWSGLPKGAVVKKIDRNGVLFEVEAGYWSGLRQEMFLPERALPRRKFLGDEESVPFTVEEIEELLKNFKEVKDDA